MPGTSVVVSCDTLSASRLAESHRELKYKDGYDAWNLLFSPSVAVSFSGYSGYPIYCSDEDNLLILLEGLIYDATDTEIHSLLLEISENYRDQRDYKSIVTNFIDGFDGDYLVVLYFKKEDRMIIFNDRWGRLPVFFLQYDQVFALSRELKFLLYWIPSIEFDPFAIAEFLTLEYTLGEKTLVKGIRRMQPASLLQIERWNGRLVVTNEALLPVNFDTVDLGLTREQILHECVTRSLRAFSARVKRLQEKGFTIVADLTGGYDTRAVFVGLCNTGADFTAYNDVYTEVWPGGYGGCDESRVARELANLFDRKLVECSTQHPVDDFSTMRQLTYLTDGMVNCFTTLVCYFDDVEREKSLTRPVARFMGFGASCFIRHPYRLKKPYSNLAALLADDAYISPTMGIPAAYACAMMKLKKDEFRMSLDRELGLLPERDDEGRIRHLYFEYYNKLVNGGENRHRLFTWTVVPLWGKDLFSFGTRNIPSNLVGYRFYIDFLRLLDHRSLKVPIHDGYVRLDSPLSVLFYDAKMNLGETLRYNRYTFKAYVWLTSVLRRCKKSDGNHERLIQEVQEICKKGAARVGNIDEVALNRFLRSSPSSMQVYRLLTVLFYLKEIEQRFGNKIV